MPWVDRDLPGSDAGSQFQGTDHLLDGSLPDARIGGSQVQIPAAGVDGAFQTIFLHITEIFSFLEVFQEELLGPEFQSGQSVLADQPESFRKGRPPEKRR